jgi:uncharacterized protein
MHWIASALVALALLVTPAAAQDYQKGWEAYEQGEYEAAAQEWHPLAEQGNAEAQFRLGVMYSGGIGVPKNDVEALKWFRLAAEQGNVAAKAHLNTLYSTGEMVHLSDFEQDTDGWFETIFKFVFFVGGSVLVFILYIFLAGAGVILSFWVFLGPPVLVIKSVQKIKDAFSRHWCRRSDLESAHLEITRLKAEQGIVDAQFMLGYRYAEGDGAPKDDAEAVKWYRLAAEQGSGGAQYYLGDMYYEGKGVPQDYVGAYMCYYVGSMLSYVEAAKNLAVVAKSMTPAQIAEAQRMAREWLAQHGK